MAMTSNQRTATAFLGATVLTCICAATYLLTTGIDDESITRALRVSGRVAFAVLILAFVARPLQQLLKKTWTAKLLRNRKLIGVAFAGIHTAHLGLILMRANHVPEFDDVFRLTGATVYIFMYAMLITSFTGPARAIGPNAWKALHKLGIFVLFGAFLSTQIPQSIRELEVASGLLVAMAIVALFLRVVAFLRNRRPQPQ
jgi:DMSO/TMAO reductase YedYZ heme-binding membrane subunit